MESTNQPTTQLQQKESKKDNNDKLQILQKNYSSKLHDWMKIQFLDICSDGDQIINVILIKLKNKEKINNKELQYIDPIYQSYVNSYLIGENPDPYWAD